MRLTSFGGTSLPSNAAEDGLNAAARSALVDLPGGAFDMDGTPGIPLTNRISRTLMVTSSVDDTISTLLATLSRGRRLLVAVGRDGSTYRQTWAKLIGIQRRRTVQGLDIQKIGIDWERDYPYWLATADEPKYLDNSEELDDSWNLDAGNKTAVSVTGLSHSTTLNNTGKAAIPRVRITITVGAGESITDPKIYNRTTEQWIMYKGTIPASSELEIDCLSKTVSLDYADAYSSILIGSEQVDWLDLAIGNNSIIVTASAVTGTVTVNVYWSKHYL